MKRWFLVEMIWTVVAASLVAAQPSVFAVAANRTGKVSRRSVESRRGWMWYAVSTEGPSMAKRWWLRHAFSGRSG
jgi:hypothetical protein